MGVVSFAAPRSTFEMRHPPAAVASLGTQLELTPDDLRQIDAATSKIPVQGARYNEDMQKLVNR